MSIESRQWSSGGVGPIKICGLTLTRLIFKHLSKLLTYCVQQANSAFYPQRDGKLVVVYGLQGGGIGLVCLSGAVVCLLAGCTEDPIARCTVHPIHTIFGSSLSGSADRMTLFPVR